MGTVESTRGFVDGLVVFVEGEGEALFVSDPECVVDQGFLFFECGSEIFAFLLFSGRVAPGWQSRATLRRQAALI